MSLPTNSLERALVVLQVIGRTPGGLTNLEISREFGIARSTCSYILSRLEKEGYCARDKETGRYRVGLKTVTLGRGALREVGFRSVSEPTLYRLATDTGLAANLAVLEVNRVIILDRVEGPAFVKAAVEESELGEPKKPNRGLRSDYLDREKRDVGSELPVYTTAVGRVLLAYLPQQEMASFMKLWPPKKISKYSPRDLDAELRHVREQGYCMMRFEPHNESCALAAPIFDATETVKAAVSVSCRKHLPVWNDEHALSELVKDAAWQISSRLHYPKLLQEARSSASRPS